MTANANLPPIATKAGIRARMAVVDQRTAGILAAALDLVDQTEARAARRAFLQRGWARALLLEQSDNLSLLAEKLRGRFMIHARKDHEHVAGRWGIAVSEEPEDQWAAQYQRAAFRRKRIRRALGQDGLRGMAIYGENGFVRTPQDVIDDKNTEDMQDLRLRAGRAKARSEDKRPPREAILDAMQGWSIEEDERLHFGGF